jgi:Asp-tRNA(Asn)/Glu-tRNA(Gln) amidotransferase A subunit family amidase
MNKGILGAETIKQATRLMKANVFTCQELVSACYDNIEKGKHINCYVNVRNKELALKEANESQKRIEKSKSCPLLKLFR